MIKIYYGYVGFKIFILIGLSFVAAAMDGFGIILLFPLVELIFQFDLDYSAGQYLSYFLNSAKELEPRLLVLVIVSLFVSKAVFTFLVGGVISNVTAELLAKQIQQQIDAYSKVSYDYIGMVKKGKLNGILSQVDGFTEAFGQLLKFLSNCGFCLIYVSISFYIDIQVGILISGLGILLFFAYRVLNNAVNQSSHTYAKSKESMSGGILDFSAGLNYLRATANERSVTSLIDDKVKRLKAARERLLKLRYFSAAIREPVAILSLFSVLAINSMISTGVNASALMSLAVLYRAIQSLLTIQNSWQALGEEKGNVVILSEGLVRLKANTEIQTGTVVVGPGPISIVVNGLTFTHGKSQINALFRDLSFDVPARKVTLIKGKSGGGKSTLLSLLLGLRKNFTGQIIINGTELKDLDLNAYRSRIGYVSQESIIFDGTVSQNVCLDFSMEVKDSKETNKIGRCLKMAGISESEQLNKDTVLGTFGQELSGGQKQRLCLARELYKDPSLLVLDEPTSGLDSENLNLIIEAINLIKDYSTIIITSHQGEYLNAVDQVIELDAANKL